MGKENSRKCNVEHLKMIEDVINRLANNAFTIKNWFIIVFSGLLTIYLQKDASLTIWHTLLLGIIVIICFYSLHVQYLWLERCYREKYKEVRLGKCEDFDMSIQNLKKTTFRNKYISFTFMIYLWAFLFLIITVIVKDYDTVCNLWCSYCNLFCL